MAQVACQLTTDSGGGLSWLPTADSRWLRSSADNRVSKLQINKRPDVGPGDSPRDTQARCARLGECPDTYLGAHAGTRVARGRSQGAARPRPLPARFFPLAIWEHHGATR